MVYEGLRQLQSFRRKLQSIKPQIVGVIQSMVGIREAANNEAKTKSAQPSVAADVKIPFW
jgi:hypothetical protein